jgi:hypothetical protein
MKKIILILIALVVFGATVNAQSTYSKVDNKTFKSEKVAKTKSSSYTPTGYYYITKDSVKYEIYLHTTTKGKNAGQTYCYIQRISKKTGKSYWQKIDVKPEELSK